MGPGCLPGLRAKDLPGLRRPAFQRALPQRSAAPGSLTETLRELASVRVRAGYKQLHVYLRREGWPVNAKRVYRLYTDEGLTLKRRRPKRHRSAVDRKERSMPVEPNQQWAMDFMQDTLADRQAIRLLTAIDLCTQECVVLRVASRFTGATVGAILSQAGEDRGRLPDRIRVDNGAEFTSKALDHWAC